MQLITKNSLREVMKDIPKEEVVDMLHDAWCALYRIDHHISSLWYMPDFIFREGAYYKQWKERISMKSDGKDLKIE